MKGKPTFRNRRRREPAVKTKLLLQACGPFVGLASRFSFIPLDLVCISPTKNIHAFVRELLARILPNQIGRYK